MKLKHTPGNWIAVGTMVEVENDRHADICDCSPNVLGQDHLKGAEEFAWANAKLIAAAPDLLKSVVRLVALLPEGTPEVERALYAINKATR